MNHPERTSAHLLRLRSASVPALLLALGCQGEDGSPRSASPGPTETVGRIDPPPPPTEEAPPPETPPRRPPTLAGPGPGAEIAIHVAANDPAVRSPFDATPSPDGTVVYYTALTTDPDGQGQVAGVFRVAADGSKPTTLAAGAPIGAPVGITTSLDGSDLFVADPGVSDGGAVLHLPAAGGAVAVLPGTADFHPGGVAVAKVGEGERLFFTGSDPATREAGVFSCPPGGGAVRAVATGKPFADPGGVVVTASGDIYVADALADGAHAAVIRVTGGTAEALIGGLGVGYPAGITATTDGSTLIVSGLDPSTRHDLVYFVDVETAAISTLTDPVGAFTESAGLHRAHDLDVFAWADGSANGTGTVYVLRP